MKKTLYSVCISFLFIVSIFLISSVLTFLVAQPIRDKKVEKTQITIDGYVIERREEGRNLSFYLKENEEMSLPKVVVLAYSLYDNEKASFVFIVETEQSYIHATINQGGFASGIVVEKR